MKKLVVSLFAVLLLWSCSQEDKVVPTVSLVGNWQWVSSSGGIAGTLETPASTGDSQRLEISETSVKRYRNGVLEFNIMYVIESQESQLFNEPRNMMIQENGFRQVIVLNGNRLLLIGDCNDCFTSEYIRQGE